MNEAHEQSANDWLVLGGLALGVLVTNGFARFAYSLILPAMQADLGWTYAQAGWLNTANALGYIAGAVLTMALIARVQPATLFAVGLASTAVALFATGLHEALWWQTLWRAITGLTGALSFSTAGALTSGLFPGAPRRNALAIAILFGSGGGLGIVLAGAAVPPLLELWGGDSWPWIWILIGATSALMVPAGLWAARRSESAPQGSAARVRLPVIRMLPEFAGYAGFGLGYIVYLTFLSAWMAERAATPAQVALVWTLLGLCIAASPFLWRGIFARHASGRPLALVLTGIAIGSALPVLWPSLLGLVVSAIIFGGSVFMAPGAVTNFSRQNLPPEAWAAAISRFTVVFAVAQTIGPFGAGLLGDAHGSIGVSLLAASGVLLLGAAIALFQRPLE